jgi:DNA-directed RNA polymerase specialized sigma24 family protein
VDLCEDPDAYSGDAYVEKLWDPADEARLVDLMVAQLEAAKIPEVAFMILDAEAAGTKHAEIAEELRISEEAVTTRLRTMRRGFRRRVEEAGLNELAPGAERMREGHARRGPRRR